MQRPVQETRAQAEPDNTRPAVGPVTSAASDGVRQWAAIALAVALVATLGWWLLGRGPEVRVAAPARGDGAEVVYATGSVEPVLWSKVAALQRKRIVDICHCEGRAVRKGDVLVRLDDDEERSGLAELEARLQRYREDAERLRGLVERNVTARTIYEEKLTQVREYEARVEAQKERIDLLKLKAPMDGIVMRRDGEVGEIAGTNASDVLLWVGQPRPLRVSAEVNEDDIPRVRQGQRALLRHEGSAGEALAATVDSITPKGDPQTKTFRVYLALPDDTPLKVGMSVEANIVVAEAKNVLLVPSEAVASGVVQVVADGRARRRSVKAGIRGTRMTEIVDGLSASDRIVVPFKADLADGSQVRTQAMSGK
ncbi:MAG: efflux RND transporter periplasmic adaptor subunit [Hyphomicrobiaceae bacterium]